MEPEWSGTLVERNEGVHVITREQLRAAVKRMAEVVRGAGTQGP